MATRSLNSSGKIDDLLSGTGVSIPMMAENARQFETFVSELEDDDFDEDEDEDDDLEEDDDFVKPDTEEVAGDDDEDFDLDEDFSDPAFDDEEEEEEEFFDDGF